ncbi:MAG: CHAT domain-containing protein [Erythrobacter sp.]
MFDRRWAVVCRDSAQPIAEVFAFKDYNAAAKERLRAMRRFTVSCEGAAVSPVAAIPGAEKSECRVDGTDLRWDTISARSGGMTFVTDGFAAYDDATMLALRSVLGNAVAQGTIDVASTSVADPSSFARVQAETLKPEQALAEGYRRNLAGEYAEAAAYFETLQKRLANDKEAVISPGEFYVNRALQKSNLGEFSVANRLFDSARGFTGDDPVSARLLRNFEAIHLLNQGFYEAAIERLSQELGADASGAAEIDGEVAITLPLAQRLNQAQSSGFLFGIVDELKLTIDERATIIDAQALQIRGAARRINGDDDGARADLLAAYDQAIAVRDGRVTSIARLRSQVLADLSAIEERAGNLDNAELYLRNGIAIVKAQYPERRVVSALEARLASYYLRNGRKDDALALYRGVVDRALGKRNAVTGFANQLSPYYNELAGRVATEPQAADDFFKAVQVLVRPGVAETQAILARQLSGNSDEASRLFRQAIDLGRDIERARIRFEALGNAASNPENRAELDLLATQIRELEASQINTQVKLNAYPQYRAVAASSLELSEFRETLKEGEVYSRLVLVGDDVFMFYTDAEKASAYRVDMSVEDLDIAVDTIRASISILEGGEYLTFPFEVAEARKLYRKLFEPIAAQIAKADHLIFEPDGAMLRLPVDLLVTDDASVRLYQARVAEPDGDEYDFTGVKWLGRGKMVSTALSAQGFVQSRKVERSAASRQYLGLGENLPVGDAFPSRTRSASSDVSGATLTDCNWPLSWWNNPIDGGELMTASRLIGSGQSDVITGAEFNDDLIKQKTDLNNYRVLHFATHGLVTPPISDCPAKPALVTSFAGDRSDGLLSFDEIFELELDADIVILSACDTAGSASIEATRAAGISSGGGTELEGLVRAFIGAGGRAVMASHWPAPDDYDATERLMSEMFRRGKSETIGDALGQSQELLMDDVQTSHPYYWAGFAVIGDAARPLLAPTRAAVSTDQSAGMAAE